MSVVGAMKKSYAQRLKDDNASTRPSLYAERKLCVTSKNSAQNDETRRRADEKRHHRELVGLRRVEEERVRRE